MWRDAAMWMMQMQRNRAFALLNAFALQGIYLRWKRLRVA
jgi:hypothetical protein